MAGKFIKGALVEFIPTFSASVPNVIIFQYNPEEMSHSWTQAESVNAVNSKNESNPLAVKSVPGESFSFTIKMDAKDTIADGSLVPGYVDLAQKTGIYSRLAALEMLLFPRLTDDPKSKLVKTPSSQADSTPVPVVREVPIMQVPTVLFVWGPGRILPVRVTQLNITEKLHDAFLNPTHAEATLGLRVLTPEELEFVNGPLKKMAQRAYIYSQTLREGLAVANLANGANSVFGMLPLSI